MMLPDEKQKDFEDLAALVCHFMAWMVGIVAVVVAVAMIGSAAAQQAAPQMAAGDRVAHHIGQLFIQVQQQQDAMQSLQEQLAKAQARIKELEEAANKKE